jgi:hypothetical protein
MKRQLVDVELHRNGEPVGERCSTGVDLTSEDDVRNMFGEAIKRHGLDGTDGAQLHLFRRGGQDVLLTYPTA